MNLDIKNRSIIIFPQFENSNIIDEIREKYDYEFALNDMLPLW